MQAGHGASLGSMPDVPGRRRSLFSRISSPKVMLYLGVFDLVLGVFYVAKPQQRGSGIFLMVAGALLIGASLFIRRGEQRRIRKALERSEQKKVTSRKPAAATARARGPKAGAGHRRAGPARQRAAAPPPPKGLAEKLFGGKGEVKE